MLNPDQQDALRKIATAAVACEQQTGIPAELTASQCIFESAWLARAPGNNCFGIKTDQHGSGEQYVMTHEYINGTYEEMPLAFETYATLADCFADHARLIQSGIYAPGWQAYQQNHDLDAYIRRVAAHYATNPDYYSHIDSEAHSLTVQRAIQQVRMDIG